MNDVLSDIRARLLQGAYKNEEHVRLNLVARLLIELGWNVWDPAEVNAEWVVARTEDGTKVDLALFVNSYAPSVFLEIKSVGKLAGNLVAVERQLRDYNRNNTAMFSVITDGREWRLYYSQTGGEFAQKCFKVVNLIEDDLQDIENTLKAFLSKAAIDIGSAKTDAETYLQLSQLQRAMDDCLPEARRQIQEPPYLTLPECLVALVQQKGFTISREEAVLHISKADERSLMNLAGLPVDAPATANPVARVALPPNVRVLSADNPGDLRFTKILESSFAGISAIRWNELVAAAVRLALHQGVTLQELRSSLSANLREGNHTDRGFALIPGTDVSIQNMDAGSAARNLVALARKLGTRLRVKVQWGGDSPLAGQIGVLEWQP